MGEIDGEVSEVRLNDPESDDTLHEARARGRVFDIPAGSFRKEKSTYLGYGDIDLSDAEPIPGVYTEVNKSLQEGEGRHEGVQERHTLRDGSVQDGSWQQHFGVVLPDAGHGDISPRPSGLRVVREDSSEDETVPPTPVVEALDPASDSSNDSAVANFVPMPDEESPAVRAFWEGVDCDR